MAVSFVVSLFLHEFLYDLNTCVFAASIDLNLVLDIEVLCVIMAVCDRKAM
jgi:hypothetical protein